MERLTSYELHGVLEFLKQVYTPVGLGQFREHVIRNIRKLIPCEIATYDEMNPDRHTSIDLGSPNGAFPPSVSHLWQRVMHEHPVLIHCQRTGDLHSYRISDFYGQREYRRRALYLEYYKKIGIEDALCKGIRVSGPVVVGCGLHRTRRTFTTKDRLVFDLAGPHLTQAWRNARAFTAIQDEMQSLRRTLDRLDRGVVELDRRGRVLMMTPRARRLLTECFGPGEVRARRLPSRLRLWVRHQSSLVESIDTLQPRTPLVVEREGRQIVFRLLTESERKILLIEERRDSADPKALLPLGLTYREAEVLVWVAQGKTNAEIAVILGMSPRTVHKHMEHIMAKLGVETRTAAARIVLQGAS